MKAVKSNPKILLLGIAVISLAVVVSRIETGRNIYLQTSCLIRTLDPAAERGLEENGLGLWERMVYHLILATSAPDQEKKITSSFPSYQPELFYRQDGQLANPSHRLG